MRPALANSRGNRHEENTARLVKVALEMPPEVGAALLATAEGYTPFQTPEIVGTPGMSKGLGKIRLIGTGGHIAGIVVGLPRAAIVTLDQLRTGQMGPIRLLLLLVLIDWFSNVSTGSWSTVLQFIGMPFRQS